MASLLRYCQLGHPSDEPAGALLDFADDTARYLYANQSYMQQLAGMNYNLQTGEDSLNSTRENAIPDLFREFVQISRSSKKKKNTIISITATTSASTSKSSCRSTTILWS